MASLDGTLTITKSEYRPCVVDRKRAMFHRWESLVEHGIKQTAAIIEYEDGAVDEVLPYKIRFLDSAWKFKNCEYEFLMHDKKTGSCGE